MKKTKQKKFSLKSCFFFEMMIFIDESSLRKRTIAICKVMRYRRRSMWLTSKETLRRKSRYRGRGSRFTHARLGSLDMPGIMLTQKRTSGSIMNKATSAIARWIIHFISLKSVYCNPFELWTVWFVHLHFDRLAVHFVYIEA